VKDCFVDKDGKFVIFRSCSVSWRGWAVVFVFIFYNKLLQKVFVAMVIYFSFTADIFAFILFFNCWVVVSYIFCFVLLIMVTKLHSSLLFLKLYD